MPPSPGVLALHSASALVRRKIVAPSPSGTADPNAVDLRLRGIVALQFNYRDLRRNGFQLRKPVDVREIGREI